MPPILIIIFGDRRCSPTICPILILSLRIRYFSDISPDYTIVAARIRPNRYVILFSGIRIVRHLLYKCMAAGVW